MLVFFQIFIRYFANIFYLFYFISFTIKILYINTENNNTKKKTMAGYPQEHGHLLRAHKKTEH